MIICEMFHGRISLNSGVAAAVSKLCEWIQIGTDTHILHHVYQVKPHSSPWFSDTCAAVIAHRNHYFRLYQQNKFSV